VSPWQDSCQKWYSHGSIFYLTFLRGGFWFLAPLLVSDPTLNKEDPPIVLPSLWRPDASRKYPSDALWEMLSLRLGRRIFSAYPRSGQGTCRVTAYPRHWSHVILFLIDLQNGKPLPANIKCGVQPTHVQTKGSINIPKLPSILNFLAAVSMQYLTTYSTQ